MRDLDPIFLEKRINKLEKGGSGEVIEHLTEVVESVDNSLIAEVEGVQKHFYFDYKDGKLGFNTDEERGADTFIPFSVGGFKGYFFIATSISSTDAHLLLFNGYTGELINISYNEPSKFIDDDNIAITYGDSLWKITLKKNMYINNVLYNTGYAFSFNYSSKTGAIITEGLV